MNEPHRSVAVLLLVATLSSAASLFLVAATAQAQGPSGQTQNEISHKIITFYLNKEYRKAHYYALNAYKAWKREDRFKTAMAFYTGASLGKMNQGFKLDIQALQYLGYAIKNADKLRVHSKKAQEAFAYDTSLAITEILSRYILHTLFETNSSRIKPESFAKLDQAAKLLKAIPTGIVFLMGHTDAVGRKDYNLKLSKQRASSVARYLEKGGIDPKRIMFDGRGEDRPVADNDTDSGRRLNRRVEAIFLATSSKKLPTLVPK